MSIIKLDEKTIKNKQLQINNYRSVFQVHGLGEKVNSNGSLELSSTKIK